MLTTFLPQIAGIICIAAYIPLIIGIVKNKVEQSFAAFMLWGMLDTIAATTTILQGGNFWLPLGYAIGSLTVALILVAKKQVSWSWIESMTFFLVIMCVVIWYTSGERAGIIASSLAVVIASVPQTVDTYKKPAATPTGPYLIFLSANILSFLAGKNWTIEERFYPGCAVFLCVIILLVTRRKRVVS
jgi:hypothetical protein